MPRHTSARQSCAAGDFPAPTIVIGWSSALDRIAPSKRSRPFVSPTPTVDSKDTAMKVHHLNCGTMKPPATASVICHVLLVETDSGLMLIDTGFGSHDCADPAGRVGPLRQLLLRPVLSHEVTAAHQVEQLGFRRDDVRRIVVTHLDLDHIGGSVLISRRNPCPRRLGTASGGMPCLKEFSCFPYLTISRAISSFPFFRSKDAPRFCCCRAA